MLKQFFTLLLWATIPFYGSSQVLEIENPSNFDRSEILSIPYSEFSRLFKVDTNFYIHYGKLDYEYQLERLGPGGVKNVLIKLDIPANSKINLMVMKGKKKFKAKKTYGRVVKERFDDFAWENDRVAFRIFGKALEGKPDDAQGIDFWAKRTDKLIINDWYKGNDYHVDHGEGLDYYSVGQTLGVGDIGFYVDDKVVFTKHYKKFVILDNGPIRTTFRLIYEPQIINGQKLTVTKTISLNVGQQFNKIDVTVTNASAKKKPIDAVVGLARRDEAQPKINFDKTNNTLVYWEPSIKDHGETGTALIVPNKEVTYKETDPFQFLLVSPLERNKTFTYFSGAAWNKAGKITSFEEWKSYVKQYVEQLQKPLIVKVKS